MKNAATQIGNEILVGNKIGIISDWIQHWRTAANDFFIVNMPNGSKVQVLVSQVGWE